jgi:DNA-directed RNA polymerase subunit N
MIIPVRCFTCGNVLADKWIPYITTVQEEKNKANEGPDEPTTTYIDLQNPKKSIEGTILDEMGLHKYCCRRMMISNAHLISSIS